MATLPKSQIDPGLPLQDPALLAWLRQYGLGVPQAGNTSPIMERLMQTTADPPAGLSDLPSRFYAPGYVPRTSTPSQINYSPMGFPEEAEMQGGEGTDTLAGGTKSNASPQQAFTMRDVDAARQFILSRTISYRTGDTSPEARAAAFNVNPIAAVRSANMIAAAEAATGAQAVVTEAWRSDATQAVYYANQHGPTKYKGVTYKPDTYTTTNKAGKEITLQRPGPGAVARPGGSNHREGGGLDFSSYGDAGKVRSWMRANASKFGMRTLGGNFDPPHIEVNERTPLTAEETDFVVRELGYADVQDFQRKNGLGADGVVGPQTTKAMLAAVSAPSVEAAANPANKPFTVYSADINKAEREGKLTAAPPMSVAEARQHAYSGDPFGVAGSKGAPPATQIAAADPAVAIQETPVSPEQVAAIRTAAEKAADTAWPSQETAALALDDMDAPVPAQQAIDDMLTGRSAEQVLAGGPRSNPRRDAPATGPVPASMGAMVSADDVLAAGPRLRPGGAPDAASVPDPTISPMRPAVGGPNDRRPQPPTPPMRPEGRWVEGAGGAPTSPPSPPSNPRRDPFGFPIDVSRPRLDNRDGTFSTEETTTFDASEVGLPSEIVTIPTIVNGRRVSEDEAKAAFAAGLNPAVQRGFASFDEANQAAMARTDSIRAARATTGERDFPQFYGEQPAPFMDGMSTGMGGPPAPMTDERRQRILADLLEIEQRDPPSPGLAGDMSAAIGGPPPRSGDLSAAMGDAPAPTNLTPASQPISIDPSFGVGYRVQRDADRMAAEQDARMAQFDRDMQADRVIAAADYYQPQNIMQPPIQQPTPRALQEARTKDDAYSLPPDFSVASEPAPIITAGPPPSPTGPIGNTISPDNDRGAGRQPFVDANRTPVSVDRSEPAWLDLPDPTPPGLQSPPVADWRDQFNIFFSPGGPGEIYDLTPPQAPKPSTTAQGNPFDALMGPGAAMGAMPFNDASQGVGAPDFSNASDASWWNGAPTGDLGLESIPPKTAAMADALDEAPPTPGEALADQALAQAYASPGASRFIDYGLKTPYTQAAANAQVYQPAGPTGGIDIRSPAARTLSEEAPPPASSSAPMFAQPPAPAGGRLGPVPGSGPFGALFGGAGGGLMGKIGANWAGPQWTGAVTQGSGPYMYDNGMGTNDWWSGNTDAMGGSTGLSWTGSDGRTITAYSNDGGRTYTHGYGPGA